MIIKRLIFVVFSCSIMAVGIDFVVSALMSVNEGFFLGVQSWEGR